MPGKRCVWCYHRIFWFQWEHRVPHFDANDKPIHLECHLAREKYPHIAKRQAERLAEATPTNCCVCENPAFDHTYCEGQAECEKAICDSCRFFKNNWAWTYSENGEIDAEMCPSCFDLQDSSFTGSGR